MRDLRRILYIRTDRMGDVLMNLPALRLLRQTYPKSWIVLAVDKSVAPLFQSHADIDEVLAVDSREIKKKRAYRSQLIKKVKKIGFDAAVVSNADKHLHWLVFRAGIRVRVGWGRKWSFLLTHQLPDDKYEALRHEMDSNLKLVSLITTETWDGRMALTVDPAALQKVTIVLRDLSLKYSSVVLIHTGTSRAEKRWDSGRFEELARRIVTHHKKSVLFVGDDKELALTQKIVRSLGAGEAHTLAGYTTLQELAALCSLDVVKAMVSCDSGPLHVCWIMGKPVVGLYAANVIGSDPHRWGPKYVRSREIYRSMKDITVDDVEHALLDALKGSP